MPLYENFIASDPDIPGIIANLTEAQRQDLVRLFTDTERAIVGINTRSRRVGPLICSIARHSINLWGEDGHGGELNAAIPLHEGADPVEELHNLIQSLRVPFDGQPFVERPVPIQQQHWLYILYDASFRRGTQAAFCDMAVRALEHVPERAPFA